MMMMIERQNLLKSEIKEVAKFNKYRVMGIKINRSHDSTCQTKNKRRRRESYMDPESGRESDRLRD